MDDRLYSILDGLGLKSYLNFIVLSFVEQYGKPSRELYQIAIDRCGGVEDVWHIGDNPRKDVFENVNSIILDREDQITTVPSTVRTLEELPKIMGVA
jgi:FMN phosphatase YigB (HAD superfamily)